MDGKVILFYLGFLPTFVNLETLSTMDIIIIAAIVSIVLGSVMLAYAYSATKAKELLKSNNTEKKMNQLAGGVMMTTGAVLIVKA